jgi:hypothetical protein
VSAKDSVVRIRSVSHVKQLRKVRPWGWADLSDFWIQLCIYCMAAYKEARVSRGLSALGSQRLLTCGCVRGPAGSMRYEDVSPLRGDQLVVRYDVFHASFSPFGVVVCGGIEHPNINVFTGENAILAQNGSYMIDVPFRTLLEAWARPTLAARHISLARVG